MKVIEFSHSGTKYTTYTEEIKWDSFYIFSDRTKKFYMHCRLDKKTMTIRDNKKTKRSKR